MTKAYDDDDAFKPEDSVFSSLERDVLLKCLSNVGWGKWDTLRDCLARHRFQQAAPEGRKARKRCGTGGGRTHSDGIHGGIPLGETLCRWPCRLGPRVHLRARLPREGSGPTAGCLAAAEACKARPALLCPVLSCAVPSGTLVFRNATRTPRKISRRRALGSEPETPCGYCATPAFAPGTGNDGQASRSSAAVPKPAEADCRHAYTLLVMGLSHNRPAGSLHFVSRAHTRSA